MTIITQCPAAAIKPQADRPKGLVFLWLKRLVQWLIIGIFGLAAVGALYQTISTRLDQRAYPPPGELIDVLRWRKRKWESHCHSGNRLRVYFFSVGAGAA